MPWIFASQSILLATPGLLPILVIMATLSLMVEHSFLASTIPAAPPLSTLAYTRESPLIFSKMPIAFLLAYVVLVKWMSLEPSLGAQIVEFLFSPNKSILIFSIPLLSDHFPYGMLKQFLHLHLIIVLCQVQASELGLAPYILARMLNLESINSHLSGFIVYFLRSQTSGSTSMHAPWFLWMLVARSYFLEQRLWFPAWTVLETWFLLSVWRQWGVAGRILRQASYWNAFAPGDVLHWVLSEVDSVPGAND